LIWGAYHGVLLVLHRQFQQVQRRLEWQPPARAWAALSWIVTATLISLGWIFFRSNSVAQARQMLQALITPASYSQHFLTASLYWLVAMVAVGYAIVLYAADKLASYRESFETDPNASGVPAFFARWRWFWIPSLYVLALLFVFLVTHGQEASAGQLMYRRF
jgi:alginate O-acetyltransferase complex protein AlgI